MVRTHNLQTLLFLGMAILVALLFLRDRQTSWSDRPLRRADALVLRHPLRVPLHVGSQSIDEIAAETRPTLLADIDGDRGTGGTGPRLAPDYRPLDDHWSADHSLVAGEVPSEQVCRRLIPAPAWSPAPQRIREHRVVEGDTLKRIAEQYLGDAERWLELYSHNRQVLASPGFLPIGTLLKLPVRKSTAPLRPEADDWQVDLMPLD